MSYKSFFSFATGISHTIKVPVGTKDRIDAHVKDVEQKLNITREKYRDNPPHWQHNDYKHLDNEKFCEIAERHNSFVREIYYSLDKWTKEPPETSEDLTPEEMQQWWPALEKIIHVPVERWSKEFYRARMEAFYEVMRGRETEGISFDTKALTQKQAAAVIILFSEYLDHDDIRLDVAKGHDWLTSSYYGEHEWCEMCGCITFDDSVYCKRKKCALKEQNPDDYK